MLDSSLDRRLPGPALKAQQQLVRTGHCGLLPESRITPMVRIQLARDLSMANALEKALLPGKVVLLLAGSGHADRALGVPRHLRGGIRSRSVRLHAGGAAADANTDADTGASAGRPMGDAFDSVWATPALPATDYCEQLKEQMVR